MMEDTKSFKSSGVPELPQGVLFQSLWCGGAMNTDISPEYSSCSQDGTCRVLLRDGVFETMIDNRMKTPGQNSMVFCIPGGEITGSIPTSCVLISSGAGLLNCMSCPGISGLMMQKVKYPDPDELLSFQEQPGDYIPAIR